MGRWHAKTPRLRGDGRGVPSGPRAMRPLRKNRSSSSSYFAYLPNAELHARAAFLRHVVEASSTEWGPAFCVSAPLRAFNLTKTMTTRRQRSLHVCLRLPLFRAVRLGISTPQALVLCTIELTTCVSRRKDPASLLLKGQRQPAGSDHS